MEKTDEEELKKKVKEITPKEEPVPEPDKVEETRKTLEELKAANDAIEAELLRKEELRAQAALGGKTEAGDSEKTPEDTANEEAKDIIDMFR